MANHTILGGKVHIYKRPNSRFWQCCTWLAGRNRRTTTKQESLHLAKEFAEDWYLSLRDKSRRGELVNEKTFREAAKQFEREYEIITEGQRSPRWVEGHKARLRLHLIPYFGSMGLSVGADQCATPDTPSSRWPRRRCRGRCLSASSR